MTRRILVTGGAGFIGSHLVDSLLEERDTEVIVADNFDPFYPEVEKQRNVADHLLSPRYSLNRIDLRDPDALSRLEGRIDAIVHLAAKAGVAPSLREPGAYYESNVGATQNLLEFARVREIEQFVFASSSSVYGVNPSVPWEESSNVLRPISPYASTKASCELMGHVYSHLYGIRFVALRLFTVYGPRQRPDLAIRSFATRMLAGKEIVLFGDGTSSRDYTYVADIVSGLRSALGYTASTFEILNLGNSHPVALRDLVRMLETALGVQAKVTYQPDRPGDVPRTWASVDAAERKLGYIPRVTLEDGLLRFAAWLRGVGESR